MERRRSYKRLSNTNSSNMDRLIAGLDVGAINYLSDFPKPQFFVHRSQDDARVFRSKAQEFRNKVLSIHGEGVPAAYSLLKEIALWTCQAIIELQSAKKKTLFEYMKKALLDDLVSIVEELAPGKECDSLDAILDSLKKLPEEFAGTLIVEVSSPSYR